MSASPVGAKSFTAPRSASEAYQRKNPVIVPLDDAKPSPARLDLGRFPLILPHPGGASGKESRLGEV